MSSKLFSPKLFVLYFLFGQSNAFAVDIDCSFENKFNSTPIHSYKTLSLVSTIERASVRVICSDGSTANIPAEYARDYNKVLELRELFYAAMAEIGNDIDNASTPEDVRLKILALARAKAMDEIKLFAKMNGLEDVLNSRSPIRMRVIKYPGLLKKLEDLKGTNAEAVANNPFPLDPDWASFSLQTHLSETAVLELYLEDSKGNLHKFKTFDSQGIVGTPGPKLREGDFQIPEGEFAIDPPTAVSSRFISMGVKANPNNLSGRGTNIKIHGSGTSEGCIVLTNVGVSELAGYVGIGNRGKGGVSALITPFKMDREDYRNYTNKMDPETKRKWSREMKAHPDLSNDGNLDDFWHGLEVLNKKFENCLSPSQRDCVSRDQNKLPDDSSCLRHPAFRNSPQVSPAYKSLASKSNLVVTPKKPDSKPNTSSPSGSTSTSGGATVVAPKKPECPRGTTPRYRIDYIDMGQASSAGTYVITAKTDDEANARANKEHPHAVKLEVKAFCMKLGPSDGYYGD
jgi:hypothetical protein